MPGDPLSRTLIELALDLREKRVTARELIGRQLPDTSALASACTPIRSERRSGRAPSLQPRMLPFPPR